MTLVLLHFIGASPTSTDWAAMVRRIIGELSRRLRVRHRRSRPRPDALRLAFANALHMAAAKGRVVLVIDALNQLEDREGALDLAWLPPVVPANVRLVLSTLPGRSLAEIERRGYPTLAIGPLEPAERDRLIVDYLASYTKALGPALRERIASAPQCANPLYLRALLDELRLWGEHETLSAQIDHYLAAPTVDALYELILARYEADYERDRPGLRARRLLAPVGRPTRPVRIRAARTPRCRRRSLAPRVLVAPVPGHRVRADQPIGTYRLLPRVPADSG